jgi:hypothetical protein
MSQQPAGEGAAPPEVIYLIRHGEKPTDTDTIIPV